MTRLGIALHLFALFAAAAGVGVFVSLAAASLLVMLAMALPFARHIPDSSVLAVSIALWCAGFGAALFAAWKFGRHTLVFEEAKSRGASFLLWETVAFPLFFLLFFIAYRSDWNWPILIGLALPFLALIAALAFPFRRCRSGFWQSVRWGGAVVAFLVFCFGVLILGRTGKPVSYHGDDPAGFPPSVRWIPKRYIPAGASRIELAGRSTACRWACEVSEPDFLKFAAKSGLAFVKVEKPRNFADKGPFPYWFHENRRGDGGGVTLRYEPGTRRLTGFFSSH